MPTSLIVDIQNALLTIAIITPRVLVCLSILPAFSLHTLTGMMRNGVAIAIVLPAAVPTFYWVQSTPPDVMFAGLLIFKESAIGLILGVVMSIPIWVAESVGTLLDHERIPIQIQANTSSVDRDASAIGALLLQAVVLVMIQSGLFLAMARIILESYGTWPAFNLSPPFEPAHLDVLIKRFGDFFWYMAVYGGPVLIPIILIDMTFALIGVFASNLQVSFISSPIKSVVGLFIILIYWPTFSHYVSIDFAHSLDFSANMMDAAGKHPGVK